MTLELPPSELANEIRLIRSQSNGPVIILEGKKDTLFYKRFFNAPSCQCFVAHNKEKAIATTLILEAGGVPGILAIVDADYDRIFDTLHPSDNILHTDTHDIETLILKSSSFDNFILEYLTPERLSELEDVRELLLICCQPLGCLRLISLMKQLNLKFEGLNIKKCITAKTFTIDLPKLVQTIKDHSQLPAINKELVLQELKKTLNDGHDLWDLCCGHDLVEVLSVGLQGFLANHNKIHVSAEYLEKTLRLAYDSSDFRQTGLYEQLLAWQSNNRDYIVLAA